MVTATSGQSECVADPMAGSARSRNAGGVSRVERRPIVRSRQGRLGRLDAVLWQPRLLRLHAPQVVGEMLLVPFEAVERIDLRSREIHLRPAREALALLATRHSREARVRAEANPWRAAEKSSPTT
jgi:hypothetical protein